MLSTFTAVYGGKNVTVPSVDGYKATATYSGTQIVKTDKTEYSIRSVATYIEQNNEVPVAVIVGITIGTIAPRRSDCNYSVYHLEEEKRKRG